MKRMLSAYFVVALAAPVLTAAPALAQRFHTRAFTVADGLPNHKVIGIAQDTRGYLWCVTGSGIATYDGTEWSVQRRIGALPPETWRHVVPAPDGAMWIVSGTLPVQTARWQAGSWTELPPVTGSHDNVWITGAAAIRRGDSVALVVLDRAGTVYMWHDNTWSKTSVSSPANGVTVVNNVAYVAAGNGVYRLRDDAFRMEKLDTPDLPAGRVIVAAGHSGGGLWAVGRTWIAQIDTTGRVLALTRDVPFHFEGVVKDLVAQDDGTGGLYVGNVSALYRLDPNGTLHHFDRHSGLVTIGVTALTRDAEGHVWVASLRGVTMIEGLRFASWTEAHGLLSDEVSVIAPLDDGRLLLGHINGVTILDRRRKVERTVRLARSRFSARVLDYETDVPGTLWLAANTAGLLYYHNGILDAKYTADTRGKHITSVRRDGREHLWFSSTDTIYLIHADGTVSTFPADTLPWNFGFFRRLFRAVDGTILAATNNGVVRATPDSLQIIARSSSRPLANVWALLDEPGEPLLLGTSRGLARVVDGVIEPVDEPAVDSPVYFLMRAPDGILWIGTSNGVVQWDGSKRTNITVDDGLVGRETNRAAAFVDADGTVWIGTASGVSRYDARYTVDHRTPPRVEVTTMEIDGEIRPCDAPVSLKYDRNNVAFHFRAITFSRPEELRFRSRLEGFDDDWVGPYTSAAEAARYVNLPPGNYRFLVQAEHNGQWGPVATSTTVSILQAWWRQPGFIAGFIAIGLVFLLGIGALVTQRRYSRRLQEEINVRTGELRRAERELSRRERLDALGVLAGGIAHDFNNLLTVILGNLELISDEPRLDTPARESISDAVNASKRARSLASQLLTFSKGGAPVRQTGSLADVTRESVAFVLRGSTVRAEVQVPDALWLVDMDADQINQVLNNILLNALQAMPNGGKVEITATNVEGTPHTLPRGRYVRLRVRDNGEGISPENLTRIFDPYFSTRDGGSGLGLATAYSIVKRHDGLLTVDSVPGEGCTFEIHLPASSHETVKEDHNTPTPPAELHARVLVMDDEPAVRDVTGAMLRRLGCEVDFAKNGEEAIDRYQSAMRVGVPFDVVILDLTVPGAMGGRAALERIRAMDPRCRAVVSSGYSGDPVLADPGAHGFAARISKPFRPADLAAAIEQALHWPRAAARASKGLA